MDNVQACPDVPGASASLAGLIMDEQQRGMPSFEVELEKDDQEKELEVTDQEGKYVFENLDVYSKYRLKPKRDNDPSNGVSTLDLVLIQKHILGLIELDSPYKLIAADANNTGSVSAGDLLDIRSLVLGLTEHFPGSGSWRFIDSKFEFENPQAPWDFQEEFIVDELYIDSDSIDFIGIKIGDVNNSAVGNILGTDIEPRSSKTMVLRSKDRALNAGESFLLQMDMSDDIWLEGLQFTLQFDPNLLEVTGISSGTVPLGASNVHFFDQAEGMVTLSWNGSAGVELREGQSLFELHVKALSNARLSDGLALNSAYTAAEAYDELLEKMSIEWRFEQGEQELFTVHQNIPNPFEDETTIRFYNPDAGNIKTSVYDNSGKVIFETEGHYSKGTHTITLDKTIFDYHGLYFYQLTDGTNTVVRKMIYTR
jgi:hypothetical protein